MNILLLATLVAQMQTVSDMETDARALELFLQDRKDYSEYCPHLPWEQPDIEVYKAILESQLPEGCKE
tara:strand:+ start:321 stop:524 length:204 start_codon:yes stop_codon:yes gene_type:complete